MVFFSANSSRAGSVRKLPNAFGSFGTRRFRRRGLWTSRPFATRWRARSTRRGRSPPSRRDGRRTSSRSGFRSSRSGGARRLDERRELPTPKLALDVFPVKKNAARPTTRDPPDRGGFERTDSPPRAVPPASSLPGSPAGGPAEHGGWLPRAFRRLVFEFEQLFEIAERARAPAAGRACAPPPPRRRALRALRAERSADDELARRDARPLLRDARALVACHGVAPVAKTRAARTRDRERVGRFAELRALEAASSAPSLVFTDERRVRRRRHIVSPFTAVFDAAVAAVAARFDRRAPRRRAATRRPTRPAVPRRPPRMCSSARAEPRGRAIAWAVARRRQRRRGRDLRRLEERGGR